MSACFGPTVSEAHLVVHIAVDLFIPVYHPIIQMNKYH